MPDKITIKDLLLRTIVGINDWERKEKQDIIINAELLLDLKKAGKTDDISNTVDYKKLKKEIIDFVEKSSPYLIENLAHNIAEICIRKPGVLGVSVEVDKPGALRFARSTSVCVEMKWRTFFISVGSNINPQENIKNAIEKLRAIREIRVEKISSFYTTTAINEYGEYDFSLPKFINGVVKIETFLERHELEDKINQIEKELGRNEKGNFSPRTIDLDIILIREQDKTTFVHKDISERDFLYFCITEIENNISGLPFHPKEKWIEKIKSGEVQKVSLA